MIPLIAWRNVWRNKTRSLVIIGSVMIGLWAGIFIMALSFGMTNERKEQMIRKQLSHIQLHEEGYTDQQSLSLYIPDGPEKLEAIEKTDRVKFASGRLIVNGMLTAPRGSGGVQITGIFPGKEADLTKLKDKVVEGEYFPEEDNQIIIGEALAADLSLDLGNKVVLTFQDTGANMVAGAFRICAFFSSPGAAAEEGMIYVQNKDLWSLLEMGEILHEIALLAKSDDQVPALQSELNSRYSRLVIETWKELSPELRYLDQMMNIFLYIFIGIILLALAFGLVNTMLMAVLERVRELGMMMSIGLNKTRIFFMILLETVFLAFTGTIIGFLLGFITVYFTGRSGIHLPTVEQGLREFGMAATLYPQLDWKYYLIIAGMVMVFTLLSSIYPAVKALRLNPNEAIRKI